MKTSSGLLLGVLFTLVVVIVAIVIYFNTRPEEEETVTSTGPSPTLPGISDLTVSRTDSPDSGSESYTIEPYTIEYDEGDEDEYEEGDNEKALSKNITFTDVTLKKTHALMENPAPPHRTSGNRKEWKRLIGVLEEEEDL